MATKISSSQDYNKGKQFKWAIPSATPEADRYNAPAKTKAGWSTSNASSSSKPASKPSSSSMSYSQQKKALDANVKTVEKKFTSNKAEVDRQAARGKSSSAVSGNADWVKGAKNAQEKADMIAAQDWMEAVTGQRFKNGDLWETTKSGVYLCQLINKVKAGCVKYSKTASMPFQCMENITMYIEGCQKLGVKPGQTFRPPDLYEKRVSYPRAIVNNIHALARIAEDVNPRLPRLEVEHISGSKF
jgi:hypothetical protein